MIDAEKRTVWGIVALLSGLALLGACGREDQPAHGVPAPRSAPLPTSEALATRTDGALAGTVQAKQHQKVGTSPIVGVDAFMQSADLLEQPVTVEGVVSAVATDLKMVALIDREEAERCGTLSCASLTLPVRWTGRMPALGQAVRATGQVESRDDGARVFMANGLTTLDPQPSAQGE